MILLETKLVKGLIAKLITKLIQKRIGCKSASTHLEDMEMETKGGYVKVRLDISVIMTEKDLVELIDRKIEEL